MADQPKPLFTIVSPAKVRQSVLTVFFTWVVDQPTLPTNYKEVARDFYSLILLLDKEELAMQTQNKQ